MSPTKVWNWRRSARWMALSLAARGLIEGIVAAMADTGELELHPRLRLESIANVVGRPWTEVEPALEEALESGKIVYDSERNVIIDQSRVASLGGSKRDPAPVLVPAAPENPGCARGNEKGEAMAGSHVPLVDLDVAKLLAVALEQRRAELEATPPTKNALRLRARRAAAKAAAVANAVATTSTTATSNPTTCSDAPSSFLPACPEQRSFAFADVREPSPLSLDLKKENTKTKRGNRVELVRTNDDGSIDITPMPTGWLEHAASVRPDIPSSIVHDIWSDFCVKSRQKNATFAAWGIVQKLWEDWLKREKREALRPIKPPRKAVMTAAERTALEQRERFSGERAHDSAARLEALQRMLAGESVTSFAGVVDIGERRELAKAQLEQLAETGT